MVKLIDPSSTEGGVIYTPELGSLEKPRSFKDRLGDKLSSAYRFGKKVAIGTAIVGGGALAAKKGYDAYKGSEGQRYKAPAAATATAPRAKPPPPAPPMPDWKARAAAAAARGGADKLEGKGGVGGIIKGVVSAVTGGDETSKQSKKDKKAWKKQQKKAQKEAKKNKSPAKPQPASTYAAGTGADTRKPSKWAKAKQKLGKQENWKEGKKGKKKKKK
tara:strand:+ start:411 stop:1061 length:651 start_codon:yes stop_codon:yes gene_type:complete